MSKPKVLHKAVFRRGPFGQSCMLTTTLCGRVRNAEDYNLTTESAQVTCKYCLRLIGRNKPTSNAKVTGASPHEGT